MPKKSRLKPASQKPVISLSRSGILQRTCECGGTPGLMGKCKAYASHLLSGQQGATNLSKSLSSQPFSQGVEEPESNGLLESQLSRSRGTGMLLPDKVRALMEPRFSFDFSQVRVHTDNTAAQMNRALKAQAFTHQQDIYFSTGKYNPESRDGQKLLAHELTHVVQQSNLQDGGGQLQRTIGDKHDLESPCFAKQETLEQCYDGEHRMQFGEEDDDAVRRVQRALFNLGYTNMPKSIECYSGSCDMDGKFGEETERTVSQFKKDHLPPEAPKDGVVGPMTMEAIDRQCKGKDCHLPPKVPTTSFSSCNPPLSFPVVKTQPTLSTCWAAAFASFIQTRGIIPKTTRPVQDTQDIINYYQWNDPGYPLEELRRLHPEDWTDFLGGSIEACTPGRASRPVPPGNTMRCRKDTKALPIVPVDHLPHVVHEVAKTLYQRTQGQSIYDRGGHAYLCKLLKENGHLLIFHSPDPTTWGHAFVVYDSTTTPDGTVWVKAMDPDGGVNKSHPIETSWTYWLIHQ